MSLEFLALSQLAARAGAEELAKYADQIKATEKGPRDLVTQADVASQKRIKEMIADRFPEHLFLGEEADDHAEMIARFSDPNSPPCWIVDPLDGTTNYVHQLTPYAVSIAVMVGGKIVAGTVYDPTSDECFSAAIGMGATLNGTRIHSSSVKHIKDSLVAASFSSKVTTESLEYRQFGAMLEECQGLRRLGSAALNLCYVAAGRLDGYWATSVKTWDVAAAWLILSEAKGSLSNLDGKPADVKRPRFVASANSTLHAKILAVIGGVK